MTRVHLQDICCPRSGSFHAVIANPPFQQLEAHLHAALDCLADGGRLSAIVPARLFEDARRHARLARAGPDRLRLAFPTRAYAKHGTSVETGLLVIDRGPGDGRFRRRSSVARPWPTRPSWPRRR